MRATIDVRPLVAPLRASGFQGVYRHRRGWRARVAKRVNLGTFPTPRQAAAAVAQWFLARYGPDWPLAFRARKATPVGAVRDPAAGGWRAFAVRADGSRRFLPAPDPGPVTFPSKLAATGHARRWLAERYGLLAPVLSRAS